jgi:hypothetical protein
MSEPDNFLARWARRKREVAAEDAKSSQPAEAARAADGNAADALPDLAARELPPFDLKDLPSVESITAETDLTPFFAPGVPPDIARAALRRAWATDPKIRDFVGLAENAWDYNTPGSMAGFGPLEMTDSLRQMVAQIVKDVATDPSAERTTRPDHVESTEISKELNQPIAIPPPTASSIVESVKDSELAVQDVAVGVTESGAPAKDYIATQHAPTESEISPKTIRRGHGGALPK